MPHRYLFKTSFSLPVFRGIRSISTIEITRNATSVKPIEWNDLIEWLADGQKTPLWRDATTAQRYIEHQKNVVGEYRSINDFIRINYLKWNFAIEPNLQKRIAVPSPTAIRRPLLTPNRFPYYLAPGIEHWLLWSDPKPADPDAAIRKVLDEEFPAEKFDRFSFINPPRLRSISDVFHAHIFTREIQR